ncbi:MAG: sigma-70 family RNA polymerase sigma factor [Planctomycetota bacterium]
MSVSDSDTRLSLLLRLRDAGDQAAWEQFVNQYGPMIHQWCLHWKLQEADACDVTQMLLVKLFRTLREFEYDPRKGRFRSWLKTVTGNAVRNFFRDSRRENQGRGDSEVYEHLSHQPARDDLLTRIEKAFDLELVSEAERRVRERVAPHTWLAFEMIERQNCKVDEIAIATGLKVAMVYVARSKVRKMLKEELEVLDHE